MDETGAFVGGRCKARGFVSVLVGQRKRDDKEVGTDIRSALTILEHVSERRLILPPGWSVRFFSAFTDLRRLSSALLSEKMGMWGGKLLTADTFDASDDATSLYIEGHPMENIVGGSAVDVNDMECEAMASNNPEAWQWSLLIVCC